MLQLLQCSRIWTQLTARGSSGALNDIPDTDPGHADNFAPCRHHRDRRIKLRVGSTQVLHGVAGIGLTQPDETITDASRPMGERAMRNALLRPAGFVVGAQYRQSSRNVFVVLSLDHSDRIAVKGSQLGVLHPWGKRCSERVMSPSKVRLLPVAKMTAVLGTSSFIGFPGPSPKA